MTFPISDLLSRCGEIFVLQLENTRIPDMYFKDSSGKNTRSISYCGYVMPADNLIDGNKIVVVNTYNYVDSVGITVFSTETGYVSVYYVPHDLQVSFVEDADITKKVDESINNSIYKILSYTGTIGSDPEIFVENEKGDNIPAFLFLGSKENPQYTPTSIGYGSSGGYPMYWDGFQAEFTTKAGECLEYHTDSIAAGMKGVWQAARAKFPDAKLSIKSVVDIPPDILMTADDEHVAFGCMPSINAYGLRVNMPPAREVPFRSAGGHIHFGIGRLSEERATPIVKGLDMILGVACVSLFANFDSRRRRILYGLPGEYRLPPHGLEYRPLSNAWLCHPFITNLVIDLARKVVILGQRKKLDLWKSSEEETIDIMMRCDAEQARTCLERNKNLFMMLLKSSYRGFHQSLLDMLFGFFMNGMETAIEDPSDFVSNWNLESQWRERAYGKNVAGSVMDNYNHSKNNWKKL